MAPLPPDVAASRRKRLNSELIDLFRQPSQTADQNHQALKGIGVYTHVACPSSSLETATPSAQRSDQASSSYVFLPLGGARKNTERRLIQGELPEEAKSIYRVINANLDAEAEAISRGSNCDPHVKFGAFELSPSTLQNGATPVQKQQNTTTAAKRPRSDILGGNTNETAAGSASTDDVTKVASASGTTYDSSRDPRRRGR